MDSVFPETIAAWQKLKRNLRALMCEWLIRLALRVCPEGYSPSIVEAVVEAHHGYLARVGREREPNG